MASINLPFAASATRRAPTTDELANGYGCGDADLELFDWMGWWTTAEIAAVILAAGLSADSVDATRLLQALQRLFPRQVTADVTLWVRTDGNDATGDGSANTSAKAFATPAAAIAYGLSKFVFGGFKLIVRLGNAGTYTSPGSINSPVNISILGDTANQASYILSGSPSSGALLAAVGPSTIEVSGVTLLNVTMTAHTVSAGPGRVALSNVTLSQGATSATFNALLAIGGSITLGAGVVIAGGTYSRVMQATYSGSNIFMTSNITLSSAVTVGVFAQAVDTAAIVVLGGAFTGSATGVRYVANNNGVIDTGGGGASFFPGNSGGTTGAGGQYV